MVINTSQQHETSVEIRPGVLRPDWSAVTSPAAWEALGGRMAARSALIEKWSHALEATEDLVWRTVLRLYVAAGRPPSPGEIAAETNLREQDVKNLLTQLQLRDLLGFESGQEAIRYAYPFTEAQTGHRVAVGGRVVTALCAIDALGVGAMYRTDISVESACRLCGETVHVTTAAEGRAVGSASPRGVVVWYDFAYDSGSAAASCCPTIAFFCSSEHLRRWLDTQSPRRQGIMLGVNDALEVGCAIFGPSSLSRQGKAVGDAARREVA
jgi:alkylmercury lyase